MPEETEPLQPLSAEALAAFDRVSTQVEAEVTRQCLAEDDPRATMGDQAEAMIQSGMGFVTRMLRATMQFAAEGILDDEVDWGKHRLPVYGVSATMVQKNFQRYRAALQRQLSPAVFAEIGPYLEQLMAKQRGAGSGT